MQQQQQTSIVIFKIKSTSFELFDELFIFFKLNQTNSSKKEKLNLLKSHKIINNKKIHFPRVLIYLKNLNPSIIPLVVEF